jgi:GNAT superfamily N-acetyltransferase
VSVAIREALEGDIPSLAELFGMLARQPLSIEGAQDRFEMIARDPEQELWVAEDDGSVVGVMAFRVRHCVERIAHYGEVSAIAVTASHKGKGVGRRLVEKAEEIGRARGCIGLWLVSGNHRREEAHRFYERLGFEGTGTRFVRLF